MKTKEELFRNEIENSENIIKEKAKSQLNNILLIVCITLLALTILKVSLIAAVCIFLTNIIFVIRYRNARAHYQVEQAILIMLETAQEDTSDYKN